MKWYTHPLLAKSSANPSVLTSIPVKMMKCYEEVHGTRMSTQITWLSVIQDFIDKNILKQIAIIVSIALMALLIFLSLDYLPVKAVISCMVIATAISMYLISSFKKIQKENCRYNFRMRKILVRMDRLYHLFTRFKILMEISDEELALIKKDEDFITICHQKMKELFEDTVKAHVKDSKTKLVDRMIISDRCDELYNCLKKLGIVKKSYQSFFDSASARLKKVPV